MCPVDHAPRAGARSGGGPLELEGRSLREHAARGTVINTVLLVALSVLSLAKGFLLAGLMSCAVELAAYVAFTALVTFVAERPLLAEVLGHLRSRPTVRLPNRRAERALRACRAHC